MKAQHLRHGEWAESSALEYLKKQGLTIREQNLVSPFGEIDLIMEDSSTLVFVEVRYRQSTNFLHPAESINASKQKKIIRTVHWYLGRNPECLDRTLRLDALLIYGKPGQAKFEWIQDAFESAPW